MPTADVLATVKWDTLTHRYTLSLIKLFYKGYYGMLPNALAEQLIIHSNRSVSRTRHGLIAPRFASNYVKNSIAHRGAVLWKAIGRNLVSRVLSYPPYGAVRENPGNEVGRSNGSILDCTDMKSLLKKSR